MTNDEFKKLALNPPKREESTIFEVVMLMICELPEHRKCHYPEFKVSRHRIGLSQTLSGAELIIQKAIANNKEDEIYCFHVKEYPLDVMEVQWSHCYGVSWRLYDCKGKLLDKTWCSSMERDHDEPFGKFRGRTDANIRFKAGDIVEVYDGHNRCIRLAVAIQSSTTVDRCWAYRNRCRQWLTDINCQNDGKSTDWYYGLDYSDDQAAVIDGPGYECHYHVHTLDIMPLRYPLPARLRKKYESYWNACQQQDKESEVDVH